MRFTKSLTRLSLILLSLLAGLLMVNHAAFALMKMDSHAVDAALVYGMRNQKLGLADLLGPNWIEGENGALLNVYSPFMMIATKAAKAGLPKNPSKSDLEKARKRFGKEVAFYSDTKNRLHVKFAISFYGDTPTFAQGYRAKIVGFGRGKEFALTPDKQILDQKADPVEGGQSGAAYEAINSYYFNFADLENLQEFKLVVESPNGPPLEFRMNNERLY
jgi:hypothetical protein